MGATGMMHTVPLTETGTARSAKVEKQEKKKRNDEARKISKNLLFGKTLFTFLHSGVSPKPEPTEVPEGEFLPPFVLIKMTIMKEQIAVFN